MKRLIRNSSINVIIEFGQRVKQLREAIPLSKRKLAQLAGYSGESAGTITNIENGTFVACDLNVVKKMAKVLNTNIPYLAAGVNNLDSNFEIGKNIRYLRTKADISSDELAYRVGIDGSSLRFIERGDYGTTLLTLSKIANALQIDFQDLFQYYPDANSIEINRIESTPEPTQLKRETVKVTRELLQGIINLLAAGVGFESIELQMKLPLGFIRTQLYPKYPKFANLAEQARRR